MPNINFEQILNSTSFEDDHVKYVQSAYEVAKAYMDTLIPNVVENRAFYDGHDPDLVTRKNDPEVSRSAEYVPEMRPAIETRESAILDRGQEDTILVRLNLKDEFVEDENLQELGEDKEEELNEQLRKSGFFFNVMMTWIHASELQPLSILKISREQIFDWVPKKKSLISSNPDSIFTKLLQGILPQSDRTIYEWELVEERPGVEWLDFDEFMYDKTMTKLDDCRYLIHVRYMTWNEAVQARKENNWDKSELKTMKEMADNSGGNEGEADVRIPEQVDGVTDYPGTKNMKEGKYLITETWVKTKNEQGADIYQVVVLGNNQYKLSDKPGPKGYNHPFKGRVAWIKLGSIEGQSSVDRVKPLQKLYSDVNNAILDTTSYTILPPIFYNAGTEFLEKPKWAPLAFNKVDDVDGIKQMEVKGGQIDLLLLLAEAYSAKIKQLLNAPDISQGIGDLDADEKATKTRLRAAGSQRRLRPLFESVKEDIKSIATMFVKINIIDDPDWIEVLDKFEMDVPAYSGVSTPEEEKIAALTLFEATLENPLYANVIGLMKQRQLFDDVLNKFRVDDIDSRLPTEDELQTVIQTQLLTEGVGDESTQPNDSGA